MPSPKPKHQAAFGHVRINLFAGVGPERGKLTNVTLERRRFEQSEDWYPAASFPTAELESIEQAARSAREYLTHPNGKTSAKAATPRPAPESQAPKPQAESVPVKPPEPEPPPFTPNRSAPASPPQPVRTPVRAVPPKKVPAKRPTAIRAKGRSR